MSVQTSNLNKKLYYLLKVRGYEPSPLDDKGETIPVPEDADIFKFSFKKDGKKYGDVWVTIDSLQKLVVYFGDDVADSDEDNTSGTQFTDSWNGLTLHLKNWAQRRQLSFELKNKDHLVSDMAQRTHTKKQEMVESMLREFVDTSREDDGNDNNKFEKIMQYLEQYFSEYYSTDPTYGGHKPQDIWDAMAASADFFARSGPTINMKEAPQWVQRTKQQLVKDAKIMKSMKTKKVEEGYYPMGKKGSYSDAVPDVKLIIQHTRQLEEGEKRYRNIARIFVENTAGERFAVPTIKPGIARVYARHVAEGGTPYDEKGKHITQLVEEYTKMAGFVRAVKNNQFNESAMPLINEGVNHYQSLRETLHRMTGHRGYNAYFESWTPILTEDEVDITPLNELFVQETLDPRIENVMPILSKLYKQSGTVAEAEELGVWADKLIGEALDLADPSEQQYRSEMEADAIAILSTLPQPITINGGSYGYTVNVTKKPLVFKATDGSIVRNKTLYSIADYFNNKEDWLDFLNSSYKKEDLGNLVDYGIIRPAKKRTTPWSDQEEHELKNMGEGFSWDSKKGFPFDVDHMNGPRISKDEFETSRKQSAKKPTVTIRNKDEWENQVNQINKTKFNDNASYVSNSKGQKVFAPDGKLFANWINDQNAGFIDGEIDSIEESLGAEQKKVGQLGATDKIGKDGGKGKLVGACEESVTNEAVPFIKKMGKKLNRLGQMWGVNDSKPGEIVKRNKAYDTDTLRKLRGDDAVDPHTPRDLQKKVIDRELNKRGELAEGMDYDYLAKAKAEEYKAKNPKPANPFKPMVSKLSKPKLMLSDVARKIEDVVGQTFPDGDPIDILAPWLEKQGVRNDIIKVLDSAARKFLKSKSYNDYLADVWDEYMPMYNEQNPSNPLNDRNPWRSTNEEAIDSTVTAEGMEDKNKLEDILFLTGLFPLTEVK